MMFTSFLNTLFLNIYSFFVGNRVGLVALGYYTQGDKWSKMFVSSLSQVVTSTFLPVLSRVQHQPERYRRLTTKMNRATAYLVFPLAIGLIIEATPIFHALFGSKWDSSIILFQLLLFRGIFTIFTSLYSNYLLALGHAKDIARLEMWRDGVALVGLAVTFPYMTISLPGNVVAGLEIMLWGQIVAAIFAWALTLFYLHKKCSLSIVSLIGDYLPYIAITCLIGAMMLVCGHFVSNAFIAIVSETVIGAVGYLLMNCLSRSRIQADIIAYLRGRL